MCVGEGLLHWNTHVPIIIPLWMCAFGSFPRLGKFSAIVSMHNLSDPFSLSSAFETPSILLTVLVESEVSQRISSLKNKKSQFCPHIHLNHSTFELTFSTPYGIHLQCFAIHASSQLLSSSAPKFVYLCLRGFIILKLFPMVIIFIPQLTEMSVSFLVACWAYSWHYFEFSTCLITIFHDFKLFHVKLPCCSCDSMLLWFFMVFSGLLFCLCIWKSEQFSYVGKALYTLILTIQQIANRGPSMFFN